MSAINDIIIDKLRSFEYQISKKYEQGLVVSNSDKSEHTINSEYLKFNSNSEYVMALEWIGFLYNIWNVELNKNDKFYYSIDKGATYKTLTFHPGAYSYTQLNSELKRLMVLSNHWDSDKKKYYIDLIADESDQRMVLNITNSIYKVDFTKPNSMFYLLGFEKTVVLSNGYNKHKI